MKEMLLFPFCGKVTERDYSIFRKLWKTFLGYILVVMLFVIFATTIVLIFKVEQNDMMKDVMNRLAGLNPYLRFLLICIIAPSVEELAFRLPLKIKKKSFLIAMPFLGFYLSSVILNLLGITEDVLIYAIGITLLFAVSVWAKFPQVSSFLQKNQFLWLHFLSIVFALIHYETYDFTKNLGLTLIIIGQLSILAYYMAFVRLKFGFAYAVLVHCLHNTLVALPFIIKSFNS